MNCNNKEGLQDRIKKDSEFLAYLLVDPNIISGKPLQCKTEVGKRALDVYYQFEENPKKISFGDTQDLVYSEGSQISNPGKYLAHINSTGGILRSLIISLEKIHPSLNLPHPDVAYAVGLTHDLNAIFSDYEKGGQQSKEFDAYILAKRIGWEKIAGEVAMHSDYLGAIKLMAQGADFPKKEAYSEMIRVLQGDGPLSYKAIETEFTGYLAGTDKLHLILLTVSDYIENGYPHFDAEKFDENFELRSKDILWRYHGKAKSERKTPSLVGQALVNGGMERIGSYKNIVTTLLSNDQKGIEELCATTMFFKTKKEA